MITERQERSAGLLMTDKGFLSDYGNKIKIEHSSGISVMYNTHLHPQYELYFCPDNIEQESVINGQKYRYCYPCAILSRPYTVHSMSCMEKSGTRFERFVFYFSEDTLAHLSGNLLPERWQSADTGLLFRLTPEQGVYLRDCLRQFLSGGQAPTVREKELIFGFLMNRLYSFCSDDCITEVDTSFFYIQGVLRYVAENLSEELDVERLAVHFAVSRSKLDRDFKARTGMTTHDFVDICRLNLAKYMLRRRTRVTAAQICEACGFRSESYFYLFFRKHTGMTPAQYRNAELPKNQKFFGEKY